MPPFSRSRSQGLPMPICSCSEWGRYCVSTATSVMPELTQLLKAKSMMRYLPANGTAGLARFWERRLNRSPWPPARMTANTLLIVQLILSVVSVHITWLGYSLLYLFCANAAHNKNSKETASHLALLDVQMVP